MKQVWFSWTPLWRTSWPWTCSNFPACLWITSVSQHIGLLVSTEKANTLSYPCSWSVRKGRREQDLKLIYVQPLPKQTNKQTKITGLWYNLEESSRDGLQCKIPMIQERTQPTPNPKKEKRKKKKREEENTKSINVSRSRAGELAQQWSLYIMLWVWEGKKFFTWGWWDNSASQFSCRVQFSAPAWGGGLQLPP